MAHAPDDQRPVIAMIGGGASGTLTAVHLLRGAAAERVPVRILLIDRDARHGLGRAYSTTHPGHLLNSPTATMSAVDGDDGHLVRWARAAGIRDDGFLARRDYGRYLLELLEDAERQGRAAGSQLCRVSSEIVSVEAGGAAAGGLAAGGAEPLRLYPAHGGRIDADFAVLATGLLPPGAVSRETPAEGYVADPWTPGALDGVADGRPVVVVGTGLTMLDVAMSITDAHPGSVVHAVSRHALLPREHRAAGAAGAARAGRTAWLPARVLPAAAGSVPPVGLTALVRHVRDAAAARPDDWTEIVDGLRPHIPYLWQQLSLADQQRFLRRYARYWEVHRHRVPPATARRIADLRAAGRLTIHRGRVAGAVAGPGGLRVRVDDEGAVTELDAGWLVNGTGPAADITRVRDPLLRSLLGHGLARPDAHRLGLDAGRDGALRDSTGRPSYRIFTLGPTLRGSRYETTAIPEIRGQAAGLARRLLAASAAATRPAAARAGAA